MKTKTWPFGTRVTVMIVGINRGRHSGIAAVIAEHVDTPSEATAIVCGEATLDAMASPPAVGQRREIEFRPGGPTKGHWAVVDDVAARKNILDRIALNE